MPDPVGLEELGLSPRWQALFAPYAAAGLALARVLRSDRGFSLVADGTSTTHAKVSAALLKSAAGAADLPAVGDWVVVDRREDLEHPLIDAVLSRAGAITRGDPGGGSDVQVLAANVDVVFVVAPIVGEPNLRRIERELSLAWDSGALPVIVLTKADLCDDVQGSLAAVEAIAPGLDVLAVNALQSESAEALLTFLPAGRTGVLIGPSGAGKSTLVNALLGEERQETREVRLSDGRGRHTTVARELVPLSGGGLLIDTPGLRALGLTGSEEGITSAFPEIEETAASCRFRDCSHTDEPGCAVLAAVESGDIPDERLGSYHKLMREAQVAAAKTDARLRAVEERKWKTISKAVKEYYKHGGRG